MTDQLSEAEVNKVLDALDGILLRLAADLGACGIPLLSRATPDECYTIAKKNVSDLFLTDNPRFALERALSDNGKIEDAYTCLLKKCAADILAFSLTPGTTH